MTNNCRYRKPNTLWLEGKWGHLTGQALKFKLLERLAESHEGQKQFWDNVTKPKHGCWEWQGAFHYSGYGLFSFSPERGRQVNIRAHRISYFLTQYKLPMAKVVCHECDNRKCVKPSHLFIGTRNDNAQDMVRKKRQAVGISVFTTKLTPEEVHQIRILHHVEGVNCCELARRYCVVPSTIWNAVNNILWRHLPFPIECF